MWFCWAAESEFRKSYSREIIGEVEDMTRWRSCSGRLVPELAAGAALAIIIGFAFSSVASADGPGVQIAELDCNSDPELVVITNVGDEAQALDGWQLQSDPPETQTFDLSRLGSQLPPGVSESIESGPSAELAPSTWASAFIFRDNDYTDYVRLLDDAGNVVQQVDCGTAPEPTAEPSLAGEVPNGGGPPPPAGAVISPMILTLLGGSLLGSGASVLALSWLTSGRSPAQEPGFSQSPRPATSLKRAQRLRRVTLDDARSLLPRLASGFVMPATLAVAALLLLSLAGRMRRH